MVSGFVISVGRGEGGFSEVRRESSSDWLPPFPSFPTIEQIGYKLGHCKRIETHLLDAEHAVVVQDEAAADWTVDQGKAETEAGTVPAALEIVRYVENFCIWGSFCYTHE